MKDEIGTTCPGRSNGAGLFVNINYRGAGMKQRGDTMLVSYTHSFHLGEGENDIEGNPEVIVHLQLEVLIGEQVETAHIPVDLLNDGVFHWRGRRANG